MKIGESSVIELLSDKQLKLSEVAKRLLISQSKVRSHLYSLVKNEYAVSFRERGSQELCYRLTSKGEKLAVAIMGEKYKPPRRVNSVFNLGAFLMEEAS